MRLFLVKHPIISLIMVGVICGTAVKVADIVTNGKKNKKEEVESIEE